MIVECICGQEFATTQKRLDSGRGKYCSKKCMYANRTRPSGLTYQKHKENPTSFKPGMTPHNKGRVPDASVSYRWRHTWVKKHKPRPEWCEWCRQNKAVHLANLSHEYKLELNDWAYLCRTCHYRYDRDSGAWGAATERFGRAAVQEGK